MTDIETGLKDQFSRDAAAVQSMPRDLWLRIIDGRHGGAPTWLKLVPVAVAVLFVGALGVVLVRAQRASNPGPVAVASAAPGATATPRSAATARPSASAGADLAAFSCGAAPSGGAGTATGNLSAVRVAHQDGFDRVTFEFAGSGIPVFNISQQASPHFTQDASGRPIDLAGIAGIKVVFHNASGNGTYSGSTDIKLAPGGSPDRSSINEVRQVGDFERVLSWGLGVNTKPSCLRVLQLAGPSRLVLDIQDNQ